MKTKIFVLTLICFMLSLFGKLFSQNMPVDSVTKKITYAGSLSFTIKKDEAYKKTKEWFTGTKYFTQSFDDAIFNKMTIQGATSVYYKKEGGVANTGFVINKSNEVSSDATQQNPAGSVSYTIELVFSLNKVTYKITNFIHKGTGEIGDGGPLENYPLCGAEKIGTIPNWDYYKQQVNEAVLKTIQDYKSLLLI
jgi:hypothetical protein